MAAEFNFVLFDLDDFKVLNDTYGHASGDRVLQCFADALRTHIGDNGHVVRLGGDEFCAVFIGDTPNELLDRAIADARTRVLKLKGLAEAGFGVSRGCTRAPLGAPISVPALYRNADRNMYEVKPSRAGREPSHNAVDFEDTGSWMLAQR